MMHTTSTVAVRGHGPDRRADGSQPRTQGGRLRWSRTAEKAEALRAAGVEATEALFGWPEDTLAPGEGAYNCLNHVHTAFTSAHAAFSGVARMW